MPITVIPGQQGGGFFEAAGAAFTDSSKRQQEIMLAREELQLAKDKLKLDQGKMKFEMEQAQVKAALDAQNAEAERALMRRQGMEAMARAQQARSTAGNQDAQAANLGFERSMARRQLMLQGIQTRAQAERDMAQAGAAREQVAAAAAQREGIEQGLRFDITQSVDERFNRYLELAAAGSPVNASRQIFFSDSPPDRAALIDEEFAQVKDGTFGARTLNESLTQAAGTFLRDLPQEQQLSVVSNLRGMLAANADPNTVAQSIQEDENLGAGEKATIIAMLESVYGTQFTVEDKDTSTVLDLLRRLMSAPNATRPPTGRQSPTGA